MYYILIASYYKKNTMYIDHTGKLPHNYGWGNIYHMIIYYIDRNST